MTKRIFFSLLLVAAVTLLASLVIVTAIMYTYSANIQQTQLKTELNLAAQGVAQQGQDYLAALDGESYRLTWVGAEGQVLYDTQSDPSAMENHNTRQEIAQARQTGWGESSRYSTTLMEKTIYCAKALEDGTVLRISVSRASAVALLLGLLRPVLALALAVLILSAVVARPMAKSIVRPLNQLDLEHPLENDVYEELSPLLGRVSQLHRQIQEQLAQLRQKTDEFAQITGAMKEGLVLLDQNGRVLSLNPAAQGIFSAAVGKEFLDLERGSALRQALSQAWETGHGQAKLTRQGRIYHLDLSQIQSQGQTLGAVVLAFDATEQEQAEQSRREFTANVSHELKTPLQAISGSAELLASGLVEEKDIPRFAGHIHRESARLIALVGDIIRLSQMDEGSAIPFAPVDLAEIAEEAVQTLRPSAGDLTLTLQTQPVILQGASALLYDLVYNLVDNAIRYNVPQGTVTVTVETSDGRGLLTVADTGVGIPLEHQGRVFERFYRVDPCHSKDSGGTGLGLSIVKHAALCHKAQIDLDSTPGQGTTVRVWFALG